MKPVHEILADWTRDAPGIVFQHCRSCAQVWYFRRAFCPACGAGGFSGSGETAGPQDLASAGRGTVHAATMIHRAPTPEFGTLAPYRVVLIDIDEGFRMMGHGAPALAIGDRVYCSFRALADRLLPYFEKEN